MPEALTPYNLIVRETFDAGRVQDMFDDFIFQAVFQFGSRLSKCIQLFLCEIIEDG